jgi:DNA topoisomerase-6 subunit B
MAGDIARLRVMAATKGAAAKAKAARSAKGRRDSVPDGQLELVSAVASRKAVGKAAPARPGKAAPVPKAEARRTPAPAPARGRGKKAPEPAEVAAPVAAEEPILEGEPARAAPKRRATAEQMAAKQREISISEFFTKNRHLLGFDNASKALLTTIKEAVDNSLDACEEAGILPEITIEVRDLALNAKGEGDLTKGEGRFVVVVEDNGPGIVKAQAPKIFGKLLYGSKFHRLKQSRGQQGIGISAAAMYGQLTTGQPIRVTSRIGKAKPAHYFEIQIDTRKNNPVVTEDRELADWHQEHGTRVELEIVANWQQGQRFVNRYVEHTALSNPHSTFHYVRPRQERLSFPRATDELPKEAQEIKPHPHGVELGALMVMAAADSKSRDVKGFLQSAFSRVSPTVADEIVKRAGFKQKVRPRDLAEDREVADRLHQAIAGTKIMAPPTQVLSPIGDVLMKKGLVSFLNVIETEGPEEEEQLDLDQAKKKKASKKEKEAKAEAPEVPDAPPEEGVEKIKGHNYFIATVTRPPKVYRGNPFQVEVGLAYGGSWPADKPIELFRFANRVPLLFQKGACGMTEAIVKTDWRNYLLSQPKGSLPVGPMALLVHIASVWVPFTSEAKEAVAHYPEITREIQLAAQECGRKLAAHIRKKKHLDYQAQRRSIFELYIQEVAQAIGKITGKSPDPIRREFLKLADKVTEQEMDDAALAEQSEKNAKRPRRRAEDEQE